MTSLTGVVASGTDPESGTGPGSGTGTGTGTGSGVTQRPSWSWMPVLHGEQESYSARPASSQFRPANAGQEVAPCEPAGNGGMMSSRWSPCPCSMSSTWALVGLGLE